MHSSLSARLTSSPLALAVTLVIVAAACGAANPTGTPTLPTDAVATPSAGAVATPDPRASNIASSASNAPASADASASPPAVVTLDEPVFTVGGDTRRVKVYVPNPTPTAKVPLVLFLHPAGGSPSSAVQETHLDRLAGQERFIAVFPPAYDRYWDVAVTPGLKDSDVDERYLAALIDNLIADLPIDPEQIYVAGFSMGAVMADRVACRLADRVKAAVVVSGTAWVGAPCTPSRPISIAIVHGTADGTFKYDAAERLAADWRAHNGCPEPGPPQTLGDGATAITSTGCRDGTRVTFVTVQGGPHAWFQTPDATVFAWQFFQATNRR